MTTLFPTRTRLLSPFAALALLAGAALPMTSAPARAGCFDCLGGGLGFIGGLAIGAIAGSAAQRTREVEDPEPYAQPRQRRVRQQQAEPPRAREPQTRTVKQQPKPAQQVASKSVAPVRQANVPSSGSLQP